MTTLPPTSPSPSSALNKRIIFVIPLQQFALWLAAVIVVTWAGYPGVVCVTPMAWLIALRVGLVCARQSTTAPITRRVKEAALAGAWLGFLQGLLFLVIVPFFGEIKPSERTSTIVISLGMVIVGMLAGAALSTFTANQFIQRTIRQEKSP